MDEDGANAGNLGCLQGTEDGIPQQSWTNRLALKCLINRKTANHHHWHGIWHIALDAAWSLRMSNGADGEGIVADYALSHARNVGSRGAALIVLDCALSQPLIESGLAAVELR